MLTDRHSALNASTSSILLPHAMPSSMQPRSSPPAGASVPASSSTSFSRNRGARNAPGAPSFHLGSLPRFHPAVYQPTSNANAQPPSPVQQRSSTSSSSQNYRNPDAMRQYRDFVSGITLTTRSSTSGQPISSTTMNTRPAKPRLDPLGSPGPVTPLALEDDEQDGYLGTGARHATEAAALDRLLEREAQRYAAQSNKKPHGMSR